jgi:serine/threonine protein kinase
MKTSRPKPNPNPSPEEIEAALLALITSKPVTERAAMLEAVCHGDLALRQRLASRLDTPESFPASDNAAQPQRGSKATIELKFVEAPDEAVGQTFGRYKLLERVGEGGCGVVYVAEQTEPVRRRVALKVIKLGMDTKQVVARFEAERQALAMMDHPNIAKVLDAGTTDVGRPFFVMELVRGIRITEYCDQANLSTRERLDLFIKVCQAIQHAHQKGIIHRDIKPANIFLVHPDAGGGTRLMDFGLAKIEGTEQLTQVGMIAGSPSYIAPELWRSEPFDHRIDVYSLGAVVFRALAGRPPFYAAATLDIFVKATKDPRPKLSPERPDLPVEIDGWVERALSIESQARYPSIPAMWNDLIALVMRSSSPSGELARAAFSVPA